MDPEELITETPEEPDEATRAAIPPEQFVQMVTQGGNLVPQLSEGELTEIARQVLEDYALDKESMKDWTDKMERGIKLAKLVKEEKTYPFKRAANIKYPLVTSAALQFNARAYPAIVPADLVVKAQVQGGDPQGLKAARGERVAAHMSFQLTSEVEEWEEDTDKLLLQLPIVGTMIRKWWYDPALGRPRCRLLDPGAFIINDKVKNLTDAPRCSEELPLYPSEIQTRILSGQFVDFEYDEGDEDSNKPQDFIEQHCRVDLDEDDYAEPYIVTVHKDTETVVRMVADFDPSDVSFKREQQPALVVDPMTGSPAMAMQEVVTGIQAIKRGSYFVAYKFMPGIDGGFHGTGLGLLLGDISDTINSIINMLLDAGHMASLGGGFIGSEFRIKGGSQRFEPGEWKLASATGGDIRSAIVPMTFPGPDAVLFQMLGMLIEAGKEISSTKDIMTGDSGGKVQTATTTMALIEQGMMVFTAAYKRIFRSLKQEFRMLARINATTVSPEVYNRFHDGQQPYDPAQDYAMADMDIVPVADPRSVTKMQEMAKAELLSQMAQQGLVNPQEASGRILEAASIPDREALAPQPDPMQQQMAQFMAQMTQEMAKADLATKMVEIDLTLAKIESEKASAMKMVGEAQQMEASQRLDALALMMKDRRAAIEQLITAGLGGMAIQSRNASGQGRPVVNAGTPAAPSGAGLLGGQAMAGGGTPFAGPPVGMA